jgi:hypothetical protein
MKKIIILENNNGRLANQLWQYAHIYAYCLENKYSLENRAFFRYKHYFETPKPKGLSRIFFFNKICKLRVTRIFYILIYSKVIKFLNRKKVIDATNTTFTLPPSKQTDFEKEILEKIETSKHKEIYFCGWKFRTQDGIRKYHNEITDLLRPKSVYLEKITNIIKPLRNKNKKIIGVHIRHGDYKIWKNGKYYFSFKEVREILDSYIKTQENPEEIVFIICSDDEIDTEIFEGLNYIKGLGTEIEDLYTLAETDAILGSHSTYSKWAAYYGNIEFTEFSRK